MSNPLGTAWDWVKTAPLPVVLALVCILGGWVYALETKVAEQGASLARIEAKLDQVDANVQTILKAILWEKSTRKETK